MNGSSANVTCAFGVCCAMSDNPLVLAPAALALLLELLEQPEPVLSGMALRNFHGCTGAALLAAGLLYADGHETVAAAEEEGDGVPVSLTWSPEEESYGYFSAAGWTSIAEEQLRI